MRSQHKVISKRNWDSVQAGLLEALEKADFVSFDYELTGLHAKTERYVGVAQAYEAHVAGVRQFVPVQLGLCAGKHRGGGKWELTPASIYLFPSSDSEEGRTFSVSTSALNFLAANGFDFNEWIGNGVGWMSPSEEEDRRRVLNSRIEEVRELIKAGQTGRTKTPLEIPEGIDKSQLENVRIEVDKWLKSGAEAPLEIPMESAFLRLLAHTFISNSFENVFSHSVKREGSNERILRVYRNEKDMFSEQLADLEAQLGQLDLSLGVRGLFDKISAEGKVLVGHNCFFDLLHTHFSFYGELPQYVDQFKHTWLGKFPRTFDTKYLAEANDVLGGLQPPATLKGLCDFMNSGKVEMEVVSLGEEFRYVLPSAQGGDLSHDAGYDALMTATVFLNQLGHIMERKSLNFDQLEFVKQVRPGEGKIAIQELLRTGLNRVRLVKTQPASVNLKEREP